MHTVPRAEPTFVGSRTRGIAHPVALVDAYPVWFHLEPEITVSCMQREGRDSGSSIIWALETKTHHLDRHHLCLNFVAVCGECS